MTKITTYKIQYDNIVRLYDVPTIEVEEDRFSVYMERVRRMWRKDIRINRIKLFLLKNDRKTN
jgi:hypothetical protein